MRASNKRRGALPGRKPGIFTSFASLRKAASIACSKSSAGIATWRRTLLPSSGSTDVVSDMGLRSLWAGPQGPGRRAEEVTRCGRATAAPRRVAAARESVERSGGDRAGRTHGVAGPLRAVLVVGDEADGQHGDTHDHVERGEAALGV